MAMCCHSNVSDLIALSITKEIDNFLSDYVKAFDNKTLNLERQFVKALRPYFDEQETAVLKALRKKSKGIADAAEVFDSDYWDTLLRETLDPIYNSIILAGGTAVATAVSGSFDVLDDLVLALKGNKLNKIVDINETTLSAIERAIQKGVEAGDSIPLIGMRIEQVFRDASTYRAQMIARTEVVGGYNGAANQAYLQNDIEMNQWLSTLDVTRTRPDHMDAHMQIADIKKGFDVGGEILLYPGDPNGSPENIINCRCTTIAIIE